MRKKEGTSLKSFPKPQNYDSQKSLGIAKLLFSAGGSTRGAIGGGEQAALSVLLARVRATSPPPPCEIHNNGESAVVGDGAGSVRIAAVLCTWGLQLSAQSC